MALRRLISMIEGLGVNQNTRAIRNDQQFGVRTDVNNVFSAERGTVTSITQTSVTITVRGISTTAFMATDEPLTAGQDVWVIKADDGTYVVLGSIS